MNIDDMRERAEAAEQEVREILSRLKHHCKDDFVVIGDGGIDWQPTIDEFVSFIKHPVEKRTLEAKHITSKLAQALLAERAAKREVESTPFAAPEFKTFANNHEDRLRDISYAAVEAYAAISDDELAAASESA